MSKKIFTIAIILLFSLVSFADNRSESDSVAVRCSSGDGDRCRCSAREHGYRHCTQPRRDGRSIPLGSDSRQDGFRSQDGRDVEIRRGIIAADGIFGLITFIIDIYQ